jgi:aryl-alcohol dehydrogenase-like predicted oxidoreductase
METRKLGQSDVYVTPLAFGAWAIGGWMWGGADSREAVKAMETAIENGMTTIDTAPVYGFGLSEELVGKAIHGKRSKVQILTKFGLSWNSKKGAFYFSTKDNSGKDTDLYRYAAKDRVISECEDSLKRMNIDCIDLLQIHWPDATTPVSETMEAFEILISRGLIKAGGVCNYSAELMSEAEKTFTIASNQVPYSMVNRAIEASVVPHCLKNNIGILAYSPLQRGILTGKIKPGHMFSEGDTRPSTPYYKEPNLSKILHFLSQIMPIAENHNANLSQLVLNWTLRQPGITCALAGARNSEQVLNNIGALNFILTDNELKTINSYLFELKIDIKI